VGEWRKSLKSIGLSSDITKVFMSNVSNRGDLLVGDREKVVLLNAEGEILWKKKVNAVGGRPYISEDGEVIVVEEPDGLTAYERGGDVAWKFHPVKDAVISWSTSRRGNYTAVALSNKLLLLENGKAVWENHTRGTAHFLSISANDKFIALATWIEGAILAPSDVTYFTLYSSDGRRLWSIEVEGFPQGVYVTNGGELFVLWSKGRSSVAALIRGGSVVWSRELLGHWRAALSTPEGSLFAVSGEGGTYIFDKKGNPVSHHPGIADGISDNGHLVLRGFSKENPFFFSSRIFLLSPKGEEIRRVEAINAVSTSISPNGKYIATITADGVYLLENQELIKIKEELIRKIDELLKR